MKYENINPAVIGDYLKSWNSFEAQERSTGWRQWEPYGVYHVRATLTQDSVELLMPDDTAEAVTLDAEITPDGCEAWKTVDDWYNQYIDDALMFPWERDNTAAFQAVCAEMAQKINAARPLPPLDVDKRGLKISDDSIRAVMEASKKLGWHGSTHDELREDVKHTAWLCYNGKGVWLDERESPRGIDAWVRKVGGTLTAQEICNLAFSMSNPTTDWPFAKP